MSVTTCTAGVRARGAERPNPRGFRAPSSPKVLIPTSIRCRSPSSSSRCSSWWTRPSAGRARLLADERPQDGRALEARPGVGQENLKNMMVLHTIAKQLSCEQLPVMEILKVFRELTQRLLSAPQGRVCSAQLLPHLRSQQAIWSRQGGPSQ